MKIGLYSVTYRGVWYRGEAVDVFRPGALGKAAGLGGAGTGRGAAARRADGPLRRRSKAAARSGRRGRHRVLRGLPELRPLESRCRFSAKP